MIQASAAPSAKDMTVTQSPPRLRLVGRSVSDLTPLSDPTTASHIDHESSASTHAHVAGVKVFSGARLGTGGIAPESPFLPLPPPTASSPTTTAIAGVDELRLRQLSINDIPSPIQHSKKKLLPVKSAQRRRKVHASSCEQQNAFCMSDCELSSSPPKRQRRIDLLADAHQESAEILYAHADPSQRMAHRHRLSEGDSVGALRGPPSSACMIRSFSMPVATQAEFDRRRKLQSWGVTAGYQEQSALWAQGWPVAPSNSFPLYEAEEEQPNKLASFAPFDSDIMKENERLSPTSKDDKPLGTMPPSPRPALAPVFPNFEEHQSTTGLLEAFEFVPPSHTSTADEAVVAEEPEQHEETTSCSPAFTSQNALFQLPGLSPSRGLHTDDASADDTLNSNDDVEDAESGAETPRAGSPIRMVQSASHYLSQLGIDTETASTAPSHGLFVSNLEDKAAYMEETSSLLMSRLSGLIHPDHF